MVVSVTTVVDVAGAMAARWDGLLLLATLVWFVGFPVWLLLLGVALGPRRAAARSARMARPVPERLTDRRARQ